MGYTHAHTKIGRNMKLQLGCLWHLKLAAYTNMVCKIFLDLQILNSATNVGRKVQYKLTIHKDVLCISVLFQFHSKWIFELKNLLGKYLQCRIDVLLIRLINICTSLKSWPSNYLQGGQRWHLPIINLSQFIM